MVGSIINYTPICQTWPYNNSTEKPFFGWIPYAHDTFFIISLAMDWEPVGTGRLPIDGCKESLTIENFDPRHKLFT